MLRTVIKVALMIVGAVAGLRLVDFLYFHIHMMRFRHGKAESEDTDTNG